MNTESKTHSEYFTKKPINFNEKLHSQTLVYWKLSRIFNGVDSSKITVNKALNQINEVLKELNPYRPLALNMMELQAIIVEHGTKPKVKGGSAALIYVL